MFATRFLLGESGMFLNAASLLFLQPLSKQSPADCQSNAATFGCPRIVQVRSCRHCGEGGRVGPWEVGSSCERAIEGQPRSVRRKAAAKQTWCPACSDQIELGLVF